MIQSKKQEPVPDPNQKKKKKIDEEKKGGIPESAENDRISGTEAPHDSMEFMRRQNMLCRQPATGRKGQSGALDGVTYKLGHRKGVLRSTNTNHIICERETKVVPARFGCIILRKKFTRIRLINYMLGFYLKIKFESN